MRQYSESRLNICLLGSLLFPVFACSKDAKPPVMATAPEDGFAALFDGTSLQGWRNFKGEGPVKGWKVEDRQIVYDGKPGARGDLITEKQYTDFELQLEWKISEAGNSGVIFHATEEEDYPWRTGPEMQILDNEKHGDGHSPLTSAGSNYALIAVSQDAVKPALQWNAIRLVVKGSHVEHWLNGIKVVDYHLWSDEWKALVAASKFNDMPNYGMRKSGHIVLQDHSDMVWFRNIRIKEL